MHGWLYNVSGLRSGPLDIESEGIIHIGTDKPERLQQALEDTLQRT